MRSCRNILYFEVYNNDKHIEFLYGSVELLIFDYNTSKERAQYYYWWSRIFLTAGKVLYILTILVEVSKGWRALISSTSSMTRENVGQIAASNQLDLVALAAKNVKWTPTWIPPRGASALKKEKSFVCLKEWD